MFNQRLLPCRGSVIQGGSKNLYSFNYHIDVQLTVQDKMKLAFGPMLNVMAALPNIDGALCSTPLSLADAQYWSAVQ